MNPISIEGLTKVYRDKKRRRVTALQGLDLQIEAGEVFGFLGPNGAGKSTTIKTLVGQIQSTAGCAKLFGIAAGDPRARRRIGYLPENPSFYDFLTAKEYLSLVGRCFGMDRSAIERESERVLELVDLHPAAKRKIQGYSKGMVQRLGLAQALLHDPDLFILDEPMSGLDPLGRALVKQVMIDLRRRGKTIFFSTHVTADVEAVCDRVAVLVGGKLQTVNRVSELLEKGIEGYVIQLPSATAGLWSDFEARPQSDDVCEVFVPRGKFNSFMAIAGREGVEVQLIEPRRRSIEQFFLEIVRRETE